jgi:predicted dehydrogenase
MSSDKVRWGIIGPGRIAARLLADVGHARNATAVAVASRDRARASEFAARFGIGRVHDSYESLLADPEVDAVYIALPNSLHHPWTMKALAAGKHVLCEKPYSRHPAEVVEAFDLAQSRKLVLMEAFMWRHAPQVKRFVELLPEIGELQAIRATFSFELADRGDLRLAADLDGGSLMDVGCYCVSGARLVAGSDPVKVAGEQTIASTGVDRTFGGLLTFPTGVIATFNCGFTYEHRWLEAIGRKNSLVIRDPWLGETAGLLLGDREIPVQADDRYRLELENMGDAITGDGKPLLGRADALAQARTIEALYRSAETGRAVSLAG